MGVTLSPSAHFLIVTGGGFGLLGDIVVGVIGSVLGVWLFGLLGIHAAGLIGSIIGAVAGARMLQGTGIGTAMAVPLALLIAIGVLDWTMPLTQFPSSVEQE